MTPTMSAVAQGKTLVTGGTGFIGRRLVAALARAGHELRVLGRDAAQLAALGRIEPFVGDLARPESLVGVEQGVARVVHAASLLGKWGTSERRLHDVNVRGTVELFKRFQAVEPCRFVHVSAGGVTGPLREPAVDERYPCRPATAYERTKLEAERQVLELSRRLGITALVVRPTFTYGPGDPHKLALFRSVKRGRYVFIDHGQSVNHPAFVDDVVHGIELALERGLPGETYIIGGEKPVTKRELVHTIADALGVPRPARSIPRWLASVAAWNLEWLGHLLRFEPPLTRSRVMMMADNFGYSIAKARAELGFAPRTDLRAGIEATVRDYVSAGLL